MKKVSPITQCSMAKTKTATTVDEQMKNGTNCSI